MPSLPLLKDLDVGGRKVLLRLDLNVPMDAAHKVTDDTRIQRALPTLNELCERGARTIIISHFGRPKGKDVPELSLAHVAGPLTEALGRYVDVTADCIGKGPETVADALKPGEFLMLENLRFHAGEEANDADFGAALARVGDVYVNDAFSASHRAHASIVGLPQLLPHAAGPALQAELIALESTLRNPERPMIAIIGGSKVSTKLELLGNLIDNVEVLAIGGAMANTFRKAQGFSVGSSRVEDDMLETAQSILVKASEHECKIILPIDAVVASELADGVETDIVDIDAVPEDKMILDIGPGSADAIANAMARCRSVLWNGPLGAFETAPFDTATVLLAGTTAALTEARRLVSVAGGGDTVAALSHAKVDDKLTYVSTAGGAFLEWLEGKTLPGLAIMYKE